MTTDLRVLHEVGDKNTRLNVLGEPLDECSCDPKTGWFRDGSCATDDNDLGRHVICCEVTEEFLLFLKSRGNDLITPAPKFGFAGLKPGDHWCVCAASWDQAFDAGKVARVDLRATHRSALELISLKKLESCSLLDG